MYGMDLIFFIKIHGIYTKDSGLGEDYLLHQIHIENN
ncbi:hypothetical protein ABH966_003366 [Lysinibacillus sp. RC46]